MEETQQRLLEAAGELFAKRGRAGVSMRDIASAVGVTQAAIYHYFANKDALYIGAITYLFEKLTLGISAQMAAIGDPSQRLELVVATMLRTLDENPTFRQIYLRELLDGDEERLAGMAENTFGAFYDPLYKLMDELAPGRDSQLLIFSLSALIFHHLEARKLGPHLPHSSPVELEPAALATHITQLFLYGIGPT